MSRGFIKVTAKGNLGGIEARYLPSGDAVVNFSLASTSTYTDNAGQKVENTTWLKGVAYRKTAELMAELLQKGSEIFLEGKLSVNKWQDQQGNNRETTEVIVDSFELLSRGKQQAANQPQAGNQQHDSGHHQQGNGYQQAPQGNNQRQGVTPINNGRNFPPQHLQQAGNGFQEPNFDN